MKAVFSVRHGSNALDSSSPIARSNSVIPSLRSGQALSEAKDLCARRARPFAEFTLSGANVLRVTGIISEKLDKQASRRI